MEKEKKISSNNTKRKLKILLKLKATISTILFVLFLLLIVLWGYYYNSYNGNVILYIGNQTKADSVDISIELDGKIISEFIITGKNDHKRKLINYSVFLGSHEFVIKTKKQNAMIVNKINVYFINWIVIDLYDSEYALTNEEINSSFFTFKQFNLPPLFQ